MVGRNGLAGRVFFRRLLLRPVHPSPRPPAPPPNTHAHTHTHVTTCAHARRAGRHFLNPHSLHKADEVRAQLAAHLRRHGMVPKATSGGAQPATSSGRDDLEVSTEGTGGTGWPAATEG